MDVAQSSRLLTDGSHPVLQGSQVPLDTFVLPLQGLHTGQVLSKVISGEDGVLLCDPCNCLICVPVEPLDLVSSKQPLLAGHGKRLETSPSLQQLRLLPGDHLSLRVLLPSELVRSLANVRDSELLAGHVLLELVELPLEHLHVLQVVPELLRRDEGLFIVDPEHHLIALPEELDEDKCLLQTHSLLRELAQEQFPEAVQFVKALADAHLLEVFLSDHLHPGVVEDHDGVAVCRNLSLKGLVLLDLGLQVGWILVVLIAGGLQLLVDPGVELVGISAEVLVSTRVLELLSS